MKQTARIISTYTGDTSGVCSALFELGGLIVMHDPSGCNSTYSTHDEPRWYDMDSLVFISGLTEKDAIFGNDEKIISDTVEAARELKPRFIAIAGTPIPYMTGCDYDAIALEIEARSGIPTFGFDTDGMHSYIRGASLAFEAYADKMCKALPKTEELSINILGVTPLDFSANGSVCDMRKAFEKRGIRVNSVWSMGSTIEEVEGASRATVNLVASSSGMKSAVLLKKKFGTPFVVGTPYGEKLTDLITDAIKTAASNGTDAYTVSCESNGEAVIIGESVTSVSLAKALSLENSIGARIISAVDTPREITALGCRLAIDEDEIIPLLDGAKYVIADPMYKPICPDSARFIPLPHEAFSGRIYRKEIPNLVSGLSDFVSNQFYT